MEHIKGLKHQFYWVGLSLVLLTASTAVEARAKRKLDVDTLFKLARLSSLSISPDRPLAAFVVKRFDMAKNSARSTIWLADLSTGNVRQLTNGPTSDFAPRFMSKGQVAFLSDRSGRRQIWTISVDGGEAIQRTEIPLDIDNFAVARDGRHFAAQISSFNECRTMACNAQKLSALKQSPSSARHYRKLLYRIWDHWRDARQGHIWWIPVTSGEPVDLTPGDWQTPPLDLGAGLDLSISPDAKEVAFTANNTANPAWNTNNDIFVVPTGGKKAGPRKPKNITKGNLAVDAGPVYSPDGRYIAYVSMARPGYEADRRVLTLYHRQTGRLEALTQALDRSVRDFSWSSDSKQIVFSAQNRGHRSIYRVDVKSRQIDEIVSQNSNTAPRFIQGDREIAFWQQSFMGPNELNVVQSDGTGLRTITNFNDELLASVNLARYEELEYVGAKGDRIHGFLLKPPGFNPRKKYPVLVMIHGGPQGATGNDFHPRWNLQMFTTPGVVVAAFNFHGSTGYGQAFTDAVSKNWGAAPYEDILKGVDHLVKNYPFVAKDNISAAGASYGGYLVNWILGNTDRFRCLISHAGVYDLVSMYGATEELWFPEWEFNGTPYDAPELYQKFSPSSRAKHFKTPTLVIHGEHDYRVPYTQGLQLFSALQRRGVESELLFFPDENHFVQKPQNAKVWWHTMLGWLAKHARLSWRPPVATSAGKSKPKMRIAF